MKVQLEIDRNLRLARYRLSGLLDPTEFLPRIMELLENPDFHPGMGTIFDVRDLDMSRLTAEEMKSLGEINRMVAERRGKARVAIVASTDLGYGMSRMYKVLGEVPNLEMAVFRDPVEAELWITESRDQDPGAI